MSHPLYALLWWVAAPLAVLRLAWRSRKQPGYLEHLGERYGRYRAVPHASRIWIHAVSVGETRAAAILVEALAKRFPGHRILLTHMTPTGRATGVELFGGHAERAWLPYDLGFATRRFFAHFRPEFGVILETELWPRLLESAAEADVPVFLANARLSERSARRYASFPRLTRWALGNLGGIAAQSQADADRFAALGAAAPVVTGNIKFDLDVPAEIEPWVALLPTLDPTTMGWRDRAFYLDPVHTPFLFDRAGNAGSTIWVDGRIVGCWVQDADERVQLILMEEVSAEAQRLLDIDVARLDEFLRGEHITNVFASPQMKHQRLS